MNIKLIMIACLMLSCSLISYTAQIQEDNDGGLEVTTYYGTMFIKEPVLIELIKSAPFNRLKSIRQYGITWYVHKESEYTRFTHSLGVLHILKLFGADLEEQIDGLLHDVSHTVFSHTGDHLFNHCHKTTSYQDEIHEWFLEKSGIIAILQRHGFDGACSYGSKKRHRCLEQDKPDLCADRIEYNLTGGLLDGLLQQHELAAIIKDLHFEQGQWFFDTQESAKKFALVSLQLSQNRWGALWNAVADHCAAQALRAACASRSITLEAIHFSCDDAVWSTLHACNDAKVHCWLKRLELGDQAYCITAPEESDLYLGGKFSGTDPLLATKEGLVRLSALDKEFEQQYDAIKKTIAQGSFLKFL